MIGLIGSHALIAHNINPGRPPSDVDLVGTYDDLVALMKAYGCNYIVPIDEGRKLIGKCHENGIATLILDAEIAWEGSTAEMLLQNIASAPEKKVLRWHGMEIMVASPYILYALKMEHRFKKNSPHFRKTMDDIKLLRKFGFDEILPEYQAMFSARQKAALDYAHPKLSVMKAEFFKGDGIDYVYDHDSIHWAIKLGEEPAYAYFKPEDSEVLTSRSMFDKLPYATQLASVYEEACVLALERSQIPFPNTAPERSFMIALEKVSTSITSGWWREFAWENFDNAVSLYKSEVKEGRLYTDVFRAGLKAGVVRDYREAA